MVYILRFFPLENAACFIILTYLVAALFTFYIQNVLKLKKKSGAERLIIIIIIIIQRALNNSAMETGCVEQQ